MPFVVIPTLCLFCGSVFFWFGLKQLKRCLQTRKYPSVSGHLSKADIVFFDTGDRVRGYAPTVEFEYTVEGKHYHSRQYLADSALALYGREKTVESLLDSLRSKPTITVFYPPDTPHEGFLHPSPLFQAIVPMAIGIISVGLGLFLFPSLPSCTW